jgi:uncharacterized protein YjbI with pentapeptide repeats
MPYGFERYRRRTRVFSAREKLMLSYERFHHLNRDEVDFSGAILAGSSFREVSLRGADFSYAYLRGATLVHCDLRGAIFDGAVRDGVIMLGCVTDETTSFAGAKTGAEKGFPGLTSVWCQQFSRRWGRPS